MRSVKHTQDFKIGQPIDLLFPLFSAEGEKHWVPGWDYENIMGSSDLHEDYIFLTKNHDHASTDAIWLVKKYKPENHYVQFYKVEPEDKVGIISVQCKKMEASLTQITVSYEYIALSEKGENFIESFTTAEYKTFIGDWHILLINYFKSKCY